MSRGAIFRGRCACALSFSIFMAASASAQSIPPAQAPPGGRKPPPPWKDEGNARDKARPQKPPGGGSKDVGAPSPVVSADLLMTCDISCMIWIDENLVARIDDTQPKRIPVSVGQHLLVVSGVAGEGPLRETIEIKPPQTVKLVALREMSSATFDRAMAELWLASCDLKFAGAYVESLSAKLLSKSSEADTTILFMSHSSFRSRSAAVEKLRPSDPDRQRIAEEMKELREKADHFVEELKRAIEKGREEKGLLGKIFSRGGSAVALDDALEWSSDFWRVLGESTEFLAALPARRRSQIQGRGRCEGDLGKLGVETFNEWATTVAAVRAGGLAQRAGLKLGDEIRRADGQTITDIEQVEQLLLGRTARPIELTVHRARTGTPIRIALSGKNQ